MSQSIWDTDFADLFSHRGQPAYSPARLALVTAMQYMENFSDRQAAEAVRARIDWKYALALPLFAGGALASILGVAHLVERAVTHRGVE